MATMRRRHRRDEDRSWTSVVGRRSLGDMDPRNASYLDAGCERHALCRARAEAILRHTTNNRVVAKAFAGEFASEVLALQGFDVSDEEVELWLDGAARRVLEIQETRACAVPNASISDVRAPTVV